MQGLERSLSEFVERKGGHDDAAERDDALMQFVRLSKKALESTGDLVLSGAFSVLVPGGWCLHHRKNCQS